jgi:adenylosuccinate synthase
MVMPWHLVEDQILNSQVVHGENIGTTLRGIGPCYRDKVGRTFAMRVADILSPDCSKRIEEIVQAKRKLLAGLASDEQLAMLDAEKISSEVKRWGKELGPMACDTTNYLLDELDAGKKILLEGAQGALLDIDHGTFPFVTSSNSSGVGVSSGSGIPAKWITRVLGVAKAYSTRVGGGPFPTELNDATGQKIREIGREYGTTTGRPRRCGWFDAVAVRYTARLSGITSMAVMMMDVLGHFDEVKLCVGYKLDGETLNRFPSDADELRRCQPVWETMPGWKCDVSGIRDYAKMPIEAKRYIERIEALIGVPVDIVSIGPDREQTMLTGSSFSDMFASKS